MVALEVDVQLACDGPDIPPQEEIRCWIETALSVVADPQPGNVELAVRIVDAEESRALNRRYRDQDKPTGTTRCMRVSPLPTLTGVHSGRSSP